MRPPIFLLAAAAAAFQSPQPPKRRCSPLAAAAVEEESPFSVLGVDSRRFRFWSSDKRRRHVKRVAKAEIFRCHPDTADGDGDGARLQQVLRASKVLATDAGCEAALKRALRAEAPRWTARDLRKYLRVHATEKIAAAFFAEGIDGVDICGDKRYGGDDVEHFIHALRVLGTADASEADLVEAIIRDVTGTQAGGYTFKRQQPAVRKYG
jgi:hypothetical protein